MMPCHGKKNKWIDLSRPARRKSVAFAYRMLYKIGLTRD